MPWPVSAIRRDAAICLKLRDKPTLCGRRRSGVVDPELQKTDLDTFVRLNEHASWAALGRHHGHRRLAAEPGPREVAAFRENEIDETVLPSLTHETLKELGVTALGHRRTILDAIAALRTETGNKEPSADAGRTTALPSVSPRDRAERRRVTVMFSDLVGSTALSARMDPEGLREVISAYQKCVSETVRRSGGFVAKYMGDGVLVYFGYPQAHEDDAERAVALGQRICSEGGHHDR